MVIHRLYEPPSSDYQQVSTMEGEGMRLRRSDTRAMSDCPEGEQPPRRIENGSGSTSLRSCNLLPLEPCSFRTIPTRSDSDSENHDQQPINEEVKRRDGIIESNSPRSSGEGPSNLEDGDEEDVPNMENPETGNAATNTSLVEDPVTTCSICYDHYTSSGDHRPCCLKCGHIYCKVCIKEWIDTHHRCPQCNARAVIEDIRIVYVRNLVTMNTDEVDRTIYKMDQQHREIQRRLERECWQALRVMKLEHEVQVKQCELQKSQQQKLHLEEANKLEKKVEELLNEKYQRALEEAKELQETKRLAMRVDTLLKKNEKCQQRLLEEAKVLEERKKNKGIFEFVRSVFKKP